MKILENDILLSCGCNCYNQIGHFNDKQNLLIPTKIQYFSVGGQNKKIENIFTGFYHTFIKTLS